jgi:hypothetical protein
MNAYLNDKLIKQISASQNLTEVALKCMAYRFLLLKEIKEMGLSDDQGAEFEELKDFFYGNSIRVVENPDGAISFVGRTTQVVVIRMTQKPVPFDVVNEFLGGVDLKGNGLQITEELASQQYHNMEQLIDTVRGYVKSPRRYEKYILAVKDMDFYRPHFKEVAPRLIKD